MKSLLMILLAATLSVFAPVAHAQQASQADPASPTALEQRAAQLIDLLQGGVSYNDYFGAGFQAAVPKTQFDTITASLIAQYGQPQDVVAVEPQGNGSGTVKIRFDKAVGSFAIQVGNDPDHRVAGLRVLGFATIDDSFDKIAAEIAALPGQTGFLVAEIDGSTITPLASAHADQQFAIGSTFKLYVLDELAAQIAAGERRWDDVVPLAYQSFTSLGTRNWPADTPVTINSLANWMISVSDNSAADTLIHLLGRDRIEARVAAAGNSHPDRMQPFLTTVEAFALKGDNFAAQRAAFIGGGEAEQEQIIEENQDKFVLANVDARSVSGGPHYIDSLEWFASPNDIARLMMDLRAKESPTLMSVMAINPGYDQAAAAAWKYLGYKGGSETGVLSMSLLGQRKSDGKWFVVTASWNNSDAAVDTEKLHGLVSRLLNLASVAH